MDLAVTQEIPGFTEGHKGAVFFVVENVLNLIDHAQGRVFENDFGTYRLYDVGAIDAEGRYVIDRVRNDTNAFQADESAWKVKVGVRYTF
jgi:hypothetical protein